MNQMIVNHLIVNHLIVNHLIVNEIAGIVCVGFLLAERDQPWSLASKLLALLGVINKSSTHTLRLRGQTGIKKGLTR